jgi:hypothetical protein
MTTIVNGQSAVIRTERGLTLSETRITLYDIMDYLVAGWPAKLIRDRLNLTDEQITSALKYIQTHQAEVEAEYQLVLQNAQEIRQYWEERNQERFAQSAARPPKPEREAIRAKTASLESRARRPHFHPIECHSFSSKFAVAPPHSSNVSHSHLNVSSNKPFIAWIFRIISSNSPNFCCANACHLSDGRVPAGKSCSSI